MWRQSSTQKGLLFSKRLCPPRGRPLRLPLSQLSRLTVIWDFHWGRLKLLDPSRARRQPLPGAHAPVRAPGHHHWGPHPTVLWPAHPWGGRHSLYWGPVCTGTAAHIGPSTSGSSSSSPSTSGKRLLQVLCCPPGHSAACWSLVLRNSILFSGLSIRRARLLSARVPYLQEDHRSQLTTPGSTLLPATAGRPLTHSS